MQKSLVFAAATLLSLCVPALVGAQEHEDSAKHEKSEHAEGDRADKGDQGAHERAALERAAKERAVTTSHSVTINGRSIAYRATAGTLTIRDDAGKPDASFFYVAYTVDQAGEASKRPVTFLYNGGPGSATIWLHMGSFGPVRVATSSPDATGPAPYQLVPNADSLLDKTDLVFVDAIGTGYSHGLPKAKEGEKQGEKDKDENPNKRFWGTDQDIDAFGRFIARYITVNKRWNSPKFLFGESYGTPRSAGLAKYLEDSGVALNGVVLLSSILNYGSRLPGLDNDYINLLPTFAATA